QEAAAVSVSGFVSFSRPDLWSIIAVMRPTRRPTSILGMLLYLGRGASPEAPRRLLLAVLLLLSALLLVMWYGARGTSRVATFNIENYPKSGRQEVGAFDAIRSLDAVAIGVQEITDTAAFAAAAERRLGASWRFVFADPGPAQRVGVLFDGDALSLLSTRTLRETEVQRGAKPAFEARLAPAGGGPLRPLRVHLK